MHTRHLSVFIRLLLSTVLTATAFSTPAQTVYAAGIPVTTCNVGDLIAAINTANGNGEADTITLTAGCTYTFTTADNWWFGPNALPAIASTITIEGNGATLSISSVTRLRFFYVGADPAMFSSPVTTTGTSGVLTLRNLTLHGGVAKGGSSNIGGGGAGMGGAIFNQGAVTLDRVTLTANSAIGGSDDGLYSHMGGGGIGEDVKNSPYGTFGGGFGGGWTSGSYYGTGGGANASGSGGPFGDGGGHSTYTSGGTAGGFGGAGGVGPYGGGGGGGDGGGGGWVTGVPGGSFGNGGWYGGGPSYGSGGSGVGAGGPYGGGGGFGGGGGYVGNGGFGGGGGQRATGGFGGGSGGVGGIDTGGGGAGMGGAVFNLAGTLVIVNSTLTANTARGGSSYGAGSGLGGAVFNLNGTLQVTNSTLVSNTVASGTGNGTPITNGGAVYNLGYTPKCTDPLPNGYQCANIKHTAIVTLTNSILASAVGGSDLVNNQASDPGVTLSVSATATANNYNIVRNSAGMLTGSPSTVDPQLGALTGSPAYFPLNYRSPAIDAAALANCPASDQRGYTRDDLQCDLGAYELKYPDKPTVIRSTSSTTLTTFGPTLVGIQRNAAVDPGFITTTKSLTWKTKPANAIDAYWLITPTVDSGLNLTLTLCYTPTESNGLDLNALTFWKFSAGAWTSVPGTPVTSTVGINSCATLTGINTLSTWTLATSEPTAVNLQAFGVQSSVRPTSDVSWLALLVIGGILVIRRRRTR